jgi:hypothetical protein
MPAAVAPWRKNAPYAADARVEGQPDRDQRDRNHRRVDRVEDRPEHHRRDQPPVEAGGDR